VVVGTCLTGAFPLASLARPSVRAAVLCQPALRLKTQAEVLFRVRRSAAERQKLALTDEQIDAALAALRRDPSKQLLGFHYLEDPLAELEKFTWLHERLGPSLQRHFRPVVLVPRETAGLPPWWIQLRTTERRGLTGPHVTLGGPNECDRDRLRAHLVEVIPRGRR